MRKFGVLVLMLGPLSIWCLPAQSIEDIIAKNLSARGGILRIKAVRTERLSGRISFNQNEANPFLVEMKRPGMLREELTLKEGAFIRTTNGGAGWVFNAATAKDPRALSAAELRQRAGAADFDGPLVDWKTKGNTIQLIGKAVVDGREAFKLKVTQKDGEVRMDYIDCRSFLEIKWEGKIVDGGKTYDVETFFRDHRKVKGLAFPFLLESNTLGTPVRQKIVFEKVEVDPVIGDERFGKPSP